MTPTPIQAQALPAALKKATGESGATANGDGDAAEVGKARAGRKRKAAAPAEGDEGEDAAADAGKGKKGKGGAAKKGKKARAETAGEAKQRAQATKAQILQETNQYLPRHVGHRYKEVVEKCLTCLDDDTAWDQVDDSKVADIDIGVEFIENVLLQLHEIVI